MDITHDIGKSLVSDSIAVICSTVKSLHGLSVSALTLVGIKDLH